MSLLGNFRDIQIFQINNSVVFKDFEPKNSINLDNVFRKHYF